MHCNRIFVIYFYTGLFRGVNNNILDIMLTTKPECVCDINTGSNIVNSDHYLLLFEIISQFKTKVRPKSKI